MCGHPNGLQGTMGTQPGWGHCERHSGDSLGGDVDVWALGHCAVWVCPHPCQGWLARAARG